MKKIMRSIAAILGGAFAIAVFGLMISLTFSALGRIFPTSYVDQLWGLVLFDIAALVWFLTFIFGSEGASQRATALILFVVSVLGTLAIVSSEVLLAGQNFVTFGSAVGRTVVYAFIGMTAAHLIGVYAHHALAPSVMLTIKTQDMKDELTSQAQDDASARFLARKGELGATLADRIERDVLADLDLPIPARLAEHLFGVPVALADENEEGTPYPAVNGREEPTDSPDPLRGGVTKAG